MEQYSELCPFHYLDTSYMKPFNRLGCRNRRRISWTAERKSGFSSPNVRDKGKIETGTFQR